MFGRGKHLKAGERAPEIILKNQRGEEVSLADYRGRPLVVYFYPGDETPLCTVEACTFRDQYEDFTAAGAEVIGISRDDEASHGSFAEHHRLPFTLLADTDGVAREAFGVAGGLLPGRVTFVIDGEGVIRHAFSASLRAQAHVQQALEVLRTLA